MRPIFNLSVPGVVDVGFEVRALRSCAARIASLTLRGWVGGRRWLLLCGAWGSREDAMSRVAVDSALRCVVVVWGVTQNI